MCIIIMSSAESDIFTSFSQRTSLLFLFPVKLIWPDCQDTSKSKSSKNRQLCVVSYLELCNSSRNAPWNKKSY